MVSFRSVLAASRARLFLRPAISLCALRYLRLQHPIALIAHSQLSALAQPALSQHSYRHRAMVTSHPRPGSSSPSPALSEPPEKRPRIGTSQSDSHTADIAHAAVDRQLSKGTGNKPSKPKKNKKNIRRVPDLFSSEDILTREVIALLGQDYADAAAAENLDWNAPFEQAAELELSVSRVSPSTGAYSVLRANRAILLLLLP